MTAQSRSRLSHSPEGAFVRLMGMGSPFDDRSCSSTLKYGLKMFDESPDVRSKHLPRLMTAPTTNGVFECSRAH